MKVSSRAAPSATRMNHVSAATAGAFPAHGATVHARDFLAEMTVALRAGDRAPANALRATSGWVAATQCIGLRRRPLERRPPGPAGVRLRGRSGSRPDDSAICSRQAGMCRSGAAPPPRPLEEIRTMSRTASIHQSFRQQGLVRPRGQRVLGGVCAGLGRRFGIEPWPARLLFVALLLVLPGSQLIVYPILWVLM